jgi:hypothetical protein
MACCALDRILTPWQGSKEDQGRGQVPSLALSFFLMHNNGTITTEMPVIGVASSIPRYGRLLTFQQWTMPRSTSCKRGAAKALNPPKTSTLSASPTCNVTPCPPMIFSGSLQSNCLETKLWWGTSRYIDALVSSTLTGRSGTQEPQELHIIPATRAHARITWLALASTRFNFF